MLDWLHVGLCVKHAHGVAVLPGQYTLSIIDGDLNLHELSEEEAAVYSVCASATPGFLDMAISADDSVSHDLSFSTPFTEGLLNQPVVPSLDVPDPVVLAPAEQDPEPDTQEEDWGSDTEDDPEPDFDNATLDDGDSKANGVVMIRDSEDEFD